jgi:hypothetical protein
MDGISELSWDYPVNKEFLLVRIQFAKDDVTGAWTTSDLAWAPATNEQNGAYK